jgi:antitoxin CptB
MSQANASSAIDPVRLARARFRAWHRGTREADFMIGGFFDRYHAQWGEDEIVWFETLLEEQDVDIMAWALKTQAVPPAFEGPLMDAMMRLDYVDIPR